MNGRTVLTAGSVAKWSSSKAVTNFDDFIGLSFPSTFFLMSNSTLFSYPHYTHPWNDYSSYKNSETTNTVVYGFKESAAGPVGTYNNYDVTLQGNAHRQSGTMQTIKIVSVYVHTYGILQPSVSIGFNASGPTGGISIGLSGTFWQIASSVSIAF